MKSKMIYYLVFFLGFGFALSNINILLKELRASQLKLLNETNSTKWGKVWIPKN